MNLPNLSQILTSGALLAIALLAPGLAVAQQDIDHSVNVSSTTVGPSQELQYQVEVSVTGNFQIQISKEPRFTNFQVLRRSSSPSVRIRNNEAFRSVTLQYQLRAPGQTGTYTIEPPRFQIGNETVTLDPSIIRVVSDDQLPSQATSEIDRSGERAFVDISLAPNRDPYVGEQVIVQYDLHVNQQNRNLRARPPGEPPLDHFWVEDLTQTSQMRRSRIRRYGQYWNVTPLRRLALFPMRAGPATVDSIGIPLVASTIFGSGDEETITSPSIDLDIQPLPDGAPASFSAGNIGTWDFEVDVDSDTARVGGHLIVTARINGTGRPQRVGAPKFDIPEEFRLITTDDSVHEAQRQDRIAGGRTFRYTLMPLAEGRHEIPSLRFSYFDPDLEEYITHSSDPIEINVEAGELPPEENDEDIPVVRRGESGADASPLDELFEILDPGTLQASKPASLPFPWWIFALPVIGLFLLWIEPALTRRFRRRFSPVMRRRRIHRRLRAVLDSTDKPFATRALQALRICLNDGLDLSMGALTPDEVAQTLESLKLPAQLREQTIDVVAQLTTRRYAPSRTGTSDPLEVKTRQVIDELLRWSFASEPSPDHGATATSTTMIIAGTLTILFSLSPVPAQAETEPPDPTIDYNIGTTAAKDGDLGTARLHLERALLLAPDAEPIQHNLAAVTAAVAAEDRRVASFHYHTPVAVAFRSLAPWIIAIFMWAALITALTRRFSRRPTSQAAYTTILVSAFTITFATALLWFCLEEFSRTAELAVVTVAEQSLQEAPSHHAASARDNDLPAGAIIRIEDSRDGWFAVELPGGSRGWLPADAVGEVSP